MRNRVERGVALRETSHLTVADLWPELAPNEQAAAEQGGTLAETRDAAEKTRIKEALRANAGHLAKTAKALDIFRTTLWQKMQRLQLDGLPIEKSK